MRSSYARTYTVSARTQHVQIHHLIQVRVSSLPKEKNNYTYQVSCSLECSIPCALSLSTSFHRRYPVISINTPINNICR